eukprot:CAMPEP_0176487792 /NCGR_PEP_ID=MMETSP0200_2-20121128/6340_1 /TAXON_ID=947934 /ORGANISM="Chaetoceros sp., Strain GSL56" /LENGTH=307 /DNA_ID=CAMNT_0017884683 /DNA_START=124 /DNA_END=1047 /DNA_ORIENTATION=-
MSSPSQTSDHNLSNYKSSSSPSDHAEKYQLLEQQQRALLQKEQERLERIVNDAGWAMVHVNGTAGGISTSSSSGGIGGGIGFSGGGIGGGGGGGGGSNMKNVLMGNGGSGGGGNISTTTRAMGYYDANYAAEVWQDLLPGRNGGGLIAMCQNEMDLKQDKQQTQKQQEQQEQQHHQQQQQQSHASLWKTVPKGAFLDSSQILESLNHYGTLGGGRMQLWTDESVRLLNELIVADATNRYTHASLSSSSLPLQMSSSFNNGDASMTSTAMNEGESMERLVDDLAEKFLASVFQEGRLDGLAPIVENVL